MIITARCLGLVVAAALLTTIGSVLGYPELALLGTAGLTAVAYAVGHVLWQPRFAVSRSAAPDRVDRGAACVVTLVVRPVRRWGAVTVLTEERCGPDWLPVPLVRLATGARTTVRYPVPTDRRGVLTIGPLRVRRQDPFGLMSFARTHGDPIQVWVRPRVHPMDAVPVGSTRSLDGQADQVPHGTITFDSLREYVVGDELRRVHWRTTARVGRLMVREHVDTSLPRLVLLLDNRAVAHPDVRDGGSATFEAACEAVASVVAAAIRADLPVALRMVVDAPDVGPPAARPTTPTRNSVAASAASRHPLDRLAEVSLVATDRLAGPDRLVEVCDQLRDLRPGDTLVFVTGPGDADAVARVGALRGAFASVLVGRITGADPPTAGSPGPGPAAGPGAAARTVDQVAGVLVLEAADGAEFAAGWDSVGVR
ncbi:DUF58 domain-containing protein [Solwaraspora sp. WMMD406]|uniref:DUF58 domain-containing protein n=1 Tax=Solwaraspora sp. WMMD406 TaxID=3016095 RepID=UPI00241624D4|nr:DUF58 domain-containing protein [Solwaraspora sp. WMMD406]MDG4765691.1 DUF58 domain-containing protein [Solwaraspora sp. WMMD406]